MKHIHTVASARRGAIAPMTAILMVPLLGMVAFAVDMGWITHTHNELQSAADAAALAGAAQLSDGFVSYYLPNQSTDRKKSTLAASDSAARTYARKYAGYNAAGGVASLQLPDADIELGYTGADATYVPSSADAGHPNTVKVVLRRDPSSNGALGLFFARVFGIDRVNLTATASATLFAGVIDNLQTGTGARSRILPMTYDVNDWNTFLKTGKGPDGKADVTSDGTAQLAIYPSLKDRGNFGELSLDQDHNGSSTISDWIHNGVPGEDIQRNITAGLMPLSKHDPNSRPDWRGNPGLRASTMQSVGEHAGELYLLPLFKPFESGNGKSYAAGEGSGSHYYYTIVALVGVRITMVDATGNDKAIKVQPAALIDPNAIYGGVAPAAPPASGGGVVTTFTAPKLTR